MTTQQQMTNFLAANYDAITMYDAIKILKSVFYFATIRECIDAYKNFSK